MNNVRLLKQQIDRVSKHVSVNIPLCKNCLYVSQKDVSLYCNKFKIFAIIARLGPCGTLGKEFKRK
jgi:hypothetical protein